MRVLCERRFAVALWKVSVSVSVTQDPREEAASVVQVNQTLREQGETLYKITDKWRASGSSQSHHG